MTPVAGIVDFAVTFPAGEVTVAELHETSGVPVADLLAITHCDRFPVLADGEQAWELAVRAARQVLDRQGVSPSEIGTVIYAGSGEWDLPFWSPAARSALELGIHDAHCFEVTNFCNAASLALRLGVREIASGESRFVLVLVGDRLSRLVDRSDPDSKVLFNFGDAPAAVLLGDVGGGSGFQYLSSALSTDPAWADYYQGEHEEFQVFMRRRGRRKGLAEAYLTHLTALVGKNLRAVGATLDDVAYLLFNQGDKNIHERLLDALGLPRERSVLNYHRYGHMGGADTLIALNDLLDAKALNPGDLVLLASSGMGFSWGVSAWRFRG
ncbi:hypothetical protein KIH74_25645 [Kineosporia sp. J2-2]|uniref:3-oxoacyl-[acyl-carrier-protein] synthase-3 n=1 Tax=Kineosporia corallincola TaxID=2835133 RepID=A0ABS5TMN2_9ACTN|nr:3-oxoacyl-[acyl-carrier-protein] synthase III C-terminal domain-containing protein [Kineosporia corallincola]MBT0772354.1 hypothetical protein [Kineosporia corallincola]